ncbi:hypothetical protein PIB30_069065 [Stylosanthes scabra]|uniref:Uncharacterized protein n=1 Tax=Stylosanthes scabra TaxID=79078 RepID=A0ABU6TNA9_9FABA|nr:hypothetical protein [Stylosanthes scabra]
MRSSATAKSSPSLWAAPSHLWPLETASLSPKSNAGKGVLVPSSVPLVVLEGSRHSLEPSTSFHHTSKNQHFIIIRGLVQNRNQKNGSLTFEDVENHHHKNDCWLIINGKLMGCAAYG